MNRDHCATRAARFGKGKPWHRGRAGGGALALLLNWWTALRGASVARLGVPSFGTVESLTAAPIVRLRGRPAALDYVRGDPLDRHQHVLLIEVRGQIDRQLDAVRRAAPVL